MLCGLCLALLIVRLSLSYFIPEGSVIIENLPLAEQAVDSSVAHKKFRVDEDYRHTLFTFDPNTVTYDQLIKLGFREKTARIFLKFRGTRKAFKHKEDVKKVYGISESFYNRIASYIIIAPDPLKEIGDNSKPKNKPLPSKAVIELNSTDSLALVELNGIGPAFAKRIIKYRTLLGGYIKVEQLKEVFGFTDELYNKVLPYVKTDVTLVTRISVNKDDFKTINRHPYISYEQTKEICNARKKAPLNEQGFKDLFLNDEGNFEKLLPYISFE